jgi:molybdopterin molybdotransferase
MISIDEALELVLDGLEPLAAELVPLADAAGRVAAEAAMSAVDLPPFDRSSMDGYAVRAADTAPGVPLRVAGGVAAGEVAAAELEPGTAARVSTGAAIPPGADAVLQSELAEERDGAVTPARALEPGRHIRYRGEDLRAGC